MSLILTTGDLHSRLSDDTLCGCSPETPFVDGGIDRGLLGDDTLSSGGPETPFINWGVDGAVGVGVGGSERVHCMWMSRLVWWLRGLSVVRDGD